MPDRLDLAPATKVEPASGAFFGKTVPFKLTVKNLQPQKPVFVDFQLRPRNPKHLWYSQNVLDWPVDNEGQLQDADGKTFADIADVAERPPAKHEENGDMQLVPLLEVRIPNAASQLPPLNELAPYNITLRDSNPGAKIAYVPLQLITDPSSGAYVAFNARLPYKLAGAWSAPHEIRLVWVLQMLLDICDSQSGGVCNHYSSHNKPSAVQSYYDEWSLTGLQVREDNGARIATIYEDPVAEPNAQDRTVNQALWPLSHSLDSFFLVGRDDNRDGQRDFTLDTLVQRFDRTRNSLVTPTERWNIPNILRVEAPALPFPSLDTALITTLVTDTRRILDTTFREPWKANRAIKPLLMFAQEERVRVLGLDALRAADGSIIWGKGSLTVDFAPPNQAVLPVDTLTSLKWTAYCTDPALHEPAWKPCGLEAYLDELYARHRTAAGTIEADASAAEGATVAMQLYYLSMVQGATAAVQRGAQVLVPSNALPSAGEVAMVTKLALEKGIKPAVVMVVDKLVLARMNDNLSVKQYLGNLFTSDPGSGQGKLTKARTYLVEAGKWKGGAIGAGVILGIAALGTGLGFLSSYAVKGEQPAVITGKVLQHAVFHGLNVYLNVAKPLLTVEKWIQALKAAGNTTSQALGSVLKANAYVLDKTRLGGLIGAIIGIGSAWGFFLYGVISGAIAADSIQFDTALATTIAQTLYFVVLALLGLTVAGVLIVGILAALDTLLAALCELGVKELRTVPGLGGACFSLSGAFISAVAKILYSYEPLIEIDREDFVVAGNLQTRLVDMDAGYVAGNMLAVQLPITTTIFQDAGQVPKIASSTDDLRRNAFRYSISGAPESLVAAAGSMRNAWTVTVDRQVYTTVANQPKATWVDIYRAQAGTTIGPVTTTLSAGLNRQLNAYFNMGYTLDAAKCWFAWGCERNPLIGATSSVFQGPTFDVFPASLDEFMAVSSRPDGGLGLAWDEAFPSLADADGDGLLANTRGGLDPNDAAWDSDGDGLSDAQELELSSAGARFSANAWDSDGDGLSDAQELELSSDPGRSDSDGDGINDGNEVYHPIYVFDSNKQQAQPNGQWAGGWDLRVGASLYRVSSSPVEADSDGDGLDDYAERQLAGRNEVDAQSLPYHPLVANAHPLAVDVRTNDLDGVVRPGQVLSYTTTVFNRSGLVEGGALTLDLPGAVSGTSAPLGLVFNGSPQVATQTTTLAVKPGTPNQYVAISSIARTRQVPTGSGGWRWATPLIEAPLGGFTTPARFVDAESRVDRGDRYIVAGLTSDRQISEEQSAPACNIVTIDWIRVIKAADDPNGGIEPRINYYNRSDASAGRELWSYRSPGSGGADMRQGEQRGPNAFGFPISYRFCGGNGGIAIDEVDGEYTAFEPIGQQGINPYQSFERTIRLGESDHVIDIKMTVRPGFGDIRAFAPGHPNDPSAIVEADNNDSSYLRGNSSPQIACAVGGNCLIVWDQATLLTAPAPSPKQFSVAGAIVGPDLALRKPQFALNPEPLLHDHFKPVVASDGTSFLVVWEQVVRLNPNPPHWYNHVLQTQLLGQRFDANGNKLANVIALSDPVVVDSKQYAGTVGQRSVNEHDIAWIGDRYRLVWKTEGSASIERRDLDASGRRLAQVKIDASGAASDARGAPRLAYNPVADRTLLLYGDAQGKVNGRIYVGPRNDPTSFGTYGYVAANAEYPRAAFYPAFNGWLVGWSDRRDGAFRYQALRADGQWLLGGPEGQSLSWNRPLTSRAGTTLACPAAASAPLLEAHFEELPGATSFADSSVYGRNPAICSAGNCPGAGAPGAPGSDYALRFDGVDDRLVTPVTISGSFSIAFWLRTTDTTGNATAWYWGRGLVASDYYGIALSGGRLLFGVGSAPSIRSDVVADGRWHAVVAVASQSATGNQIRLYVDGVLVGTQTGTANPNPTTSLRLGSLVTNSEFFAGELDQLQVFGTALETDTVQALSSGSPPQSFCVAAGPAQGAIARARLRLEAGQTTGAVISSTAGLRLLVDGDKPSSQVTSFTNGAFIRGPASGSQTLIIGGKASDPTSRVAAVGVSVNNGPYLPAQGTSTWAYSLTIQPNSSYFIRTLAVDVAGNTQALPALPTGGTLLNVDSKGPQLNLDRISANPLRPRRNKDGIWTLTLQGTANDIGGSGVDPQSVAMLIESATGTQGPQGNGWQPATLANSTWRLTYGFPAGLADPTGSYTITLRAADAVGNVSSVSAPLRLDTRAPEAVLHPNTATATAIITGTPLLSGVVSDTNGIAALQVRFMPISQVEALSGTVLLLPFDEPANSVWFADRSGKGHVAQPLNDFIPGSGLPGRINSALRFNGPSIVQVAHRADLDFDASKSFTLQAWVKTSSRDRMRVLVKRDAISGYALEVDGGRAGFVLNSTTLQASDGPDLSDDQWHHIAGVVDRSAGQARLYVDGVQRGEAPFVAGTSNSGNLELGGWSRQDGGRFFGLIDNVVVQSRALPAEEVLASYQAADILWLPATLTPSGGGVTRMNWSIRVPEGLEGYYQLDLRTTDVIYNSEISSNAWRGIIDNRAPRLGIAASRSAGSSDSTSYQFSAEDLYLDEHSFSSACGKQATATRELFRSFWTERLFPNQPFVFRLSVQCSLPSNPPVPPVKIQACDRYGNCAVAASPT